MLVVNLYGGPGTGKSTMAAGLFECLKNQGINCEMAREYIKEKVWEQNFAELEDQPWIFANQLRRLSVLRGQVAVAITDSPILLSLVYRAEHTSEIFKAFVKEEYSSYDNMDVFLNRVKPFNPKGRVQTEEEAKELDAEILNMVRMVNNGAVLHADGNTEGLEKIVKVILRREL